MKFLFYTRNLFKTKRFFNSVGFFISYLYQNSFRSLQICIKHGFFPFWYIFQKKNPCKSIKIMPILISGGKTHKSYLFKHVFSALRFTALMHVFIAFVIHIICGNMWFYSRELFLHMNNDSILLVFNLLPKEN